MNDVFRETALSVCRLLGDAANHRPVDAANLPDEARMSAFAKMHRLVPAVSGALTGSGIAADRYPALHDAAERAAFHQIKHEQLAADALKQVEAAGVAVLPLKGAALQAVWPNGWIRPTTDTDWLISTTQLPTAVTTLEAMGFTKRNAHDGDVIL